MTPDREDQVRAVLAWLEDRAQHSRSLGYYADAYEIAADRLREALGDDAPDPLKET